MVQMGDYLPYPDPEFNFYCWESDATAIGDAYALLTDPLQQELYRANMNNQVYGGHWGNLPSQLA